MTASKMCPNGHVMDASWDRCPYCPGGGAPRRPLLPTRVEGAAPPVPPFNGSLSAMPPPPPPPQPPPSRPPKAALRTVVRGEELAREKAPPVVGWLVVLSGAHKGEDFRIRDGRNTVGSAPGNDIVLGDPHVSATHANVNSIVKDGERVYVVVDLDSRNGTFLNNSDEAIGREEIIDSDTVIFGTTVCKFKCI